uniref:Uncharacterized protein n=1 Tax=Nelumbo nucifera TaxID=4432 RepID=A0A822ZTQ0_NELNU|nr:TPA_asm: hypothetical protein HUJ06_016672 [Nelumbo nucifera]
MVGQNADSKLVRLLNFIGIGVFCTIAINMWRDVQRKSLQQKTKAFETKALGLVYNAIKQ